MRVLDIGSGWGGLGLYLAEAGAGEVVGITLSQEQLKVSRERAARAGLAERVRFELCDYRAVGRVSAGSTGSCRSACSSTSASGTIPSSSLR